MMAEDKQAEGNQACGKCVWPKVPLLGEVPLNGR